MSNTEEEWVKVGMVLGMMPGAMPGEKMEKFSNFLNFLKMSFF